MKPRPYAVATDVRCDTTHLHVTLDDGRTISIPLAWFPRLRDATPNQRDTWELIGSGAGISWPVLDEDLSVAGLLSEAAAPAPGGHLTYTT
jgi:phosphosulfolactate phosphohydrolase-like enzyme